MNEQLKHRLIGFSVIIALLVIAAPFLVNDKKPTWLMHADKKSLTIPKAPPKTVVKKHSPKSKWTASSKPVEIVMAKNIEETVNQATLAFHDQAQVVMPDANSQTQLAKNKTETQSNLAKVAEGNPPILVIAKKVPSPVVKPIKQATVVKAKGRRVNKLIATKPKRSTAHLKYYYSVQLATFSQPKLAKKFAERLIQAKFEPTLESVKGKRRQMLTKMTVGRFKTKQQAQALQKKLDGRFQIKSLVIKHKR